MNVLFWCAPSSSLSGHNWPLRNLIITLSGRKEGRNQCCWGGGGGGDKIAEVGCERCADPAGAESTGTGVSLPKFQKFLRGRGSVDR